MITAQSQPGAALEVPDGLVADEVATVVQLCLHTEARYREMAPLGELGGFTAIMRCAIDMTAWQMHVHQVRVDLPETFTPELAQVTAEQLLAMFDAQPPDAPMPDYHFGVLLFSEGVDVHAPCESLAQAREMIAAGQGSWNRNVLAVLVDGSAVRVTYDSATQIISLVVTEPDETTCDPFEPLVSELNELFVQRYQIVGAQQKPATASGGAEVTRGDEVAVDVAEVPDAPVHTSTEPACGGDVAGPVLVCESVVESYSGGGGGGASADTSSPSPASES